MKSYVLTLLFLTGLFSLAFAGDDGKQLPKPDPAFNGTIGDTRDASKPDWPQRPKAHVGAPT